MSDLLQKHLTEESGKHSNLRLLESQWGFDQKLIPKALQSVGQLFPHYSRHDQSHSDQILINIERLLGDSRIKLLSATDTWLLLEAAYWHDIGMIVPHNALNDALGSHEFQAYRKQIAANGGHELQKFAFHFDGTDMSKVFVGAHSPLDAVDKFRLLMAEWFRRQHPNRSENAVNDPWHELGLSSPRSELIPKRLFRLLGNICALHGATFTDVLEKLPHKEVGMANDDCHPRFVACLLRLGDLLDMDDNRFCPIMQSISGDKRPALSKAHEDKHRSIRHFRLDTSRIEISAVCETIDGYVEQWRWLDYLRDEIRSQMARWLDIAPSPELGLLPTLGLIQVDLAGRHLITTPGTRPEFVLNSSRVMALFKGENLYQHEDVVREILQNAVDATLLRVWLISQHENKGIGNEPNEVSKEYFNKFSIKACLERIGDPSLSIHKIKWRLTISDQGIGISREDLPYIMNVAGSSMNVKRQAVIEAMPEWLQPSGTFGIGLQSVFMWTDVAQIRTKNYFTSEALDITLHSPTGPQNGLVTVESSDNPYMRDMGTALILDFITDAMPINYSIKNTQSLTGRAHDRYDPLLDKELPLKAFNVIDAINNFSIHSPIAVDWVFKNIDNEDLRSENTAENQIDKTDFFSETHSKFNAKLGKYSNAGRNGRLLYRGQVVADAKLPVFSFFDYEIDLYAGKAGDWLTFNRNGLTSEGKLKIPELVCRNLMLWVKRNKEILLREQKTEISVLAKTWSKVLTDGNDQSFWQALSSEVPDSWQDINCQVAEKDKLVEKTYRQVLQGDMVFYGNTYSASRKFETQLEALAFVRGTEATLCIQEWCKDVKHGVSYIAVNGTEHNFNDIYVLPKLIDISEEGQRLQISHEILRNAIDSEIKMVMSFRRLLLPVTIFPERLKMERLLLNEDVRLSGVKYIFKYLPEPTSHVLLPYEFKITSRNDSSIGLDRLDELVTWVNKNSKVAFTLHETKMAYTDLIQYIDEVVMKDSERWKKLRN